MGKRKIIANQNADDCHNNFIEVEPRISLPIFDETINNGKMWEFKNVIRGEEVLM